MAIQATQGPMMAKITCIKPRIKMIDQRMAAKPVEESQRIRGTTLQNIRAAHFARYPLCVACLAMTPERTTLAIELDHIVPLHKGGVDSEDPFENRQGLCEDHHLEKSKQERGHRYHPRRRSAP